MTDCYPHWLFDDSPIADPLRRGQRAIEFCRRLRHPKSAAAGRLLQLAPWQERLICAVYGPVDEDGDRLVCIGGLVAHLAQLRALPEGERTEGWTGEGESVAYLAGLGQQAAAAGVRLHLLGVGSLPVLRCVSPEPWFFAADSTVWTSAARFGRHLSTSPWRYGRQERPVQFVSGGEDILVERSWEERAATSIACTLHAATGRTPILGGFNAESDMEYFERVEIARRFGCDDETEAMAHLEEIIGEDLLWDEDPWDEEVRSGRSGSAPSRPGAAGRPAGERPAARPPLPSSVRQTPASNYH